MRALELRIPPPIVALAAAVLMWFVAGWPLSVPMPSPARLGVVAVLAVIGIVFDVAGLIAFRRARTTIHPLRPERVSAFVTSGVYRITRNPMYLGLVFLLLAWMTYLAAAWAIVGPVAFVAYITRLQIVPEERILRARFDDFDRYAARVRRWL